MRYVAWERERWGRDRGREREVWERDRKGGGKIERLREREKSTDKAVSFQALLTLARTRAPKLGSYSSFGRYVRRKRRRATGSPSNGCVVT